MNFCKNCGAQVKQGVPPGDDRPRYICDVCHTVHYENPKMVVGCIPEWNDKILLCRRAIEPRYGLWTLPAGYLENGETLSEGVKRETLEEAGARIKVITLYTIFNLVHISQVYLIFRAHLLDLNFKPGKESLEVKLFSENEISWDEMAFMAIKETLKLYFKDRPSGQFPLHMGTIPPHW